jgi:hypothetical protein
MSQLEWTKLAPMDELTCKTEKKMKECTGGGPVGGASDAYVKSLII